MNPATDTVSWLRIMLAFAVVGGLLIALGLGLSWLSRRGIGLPRLMVKANRRLQLVEVLPIDARRRLAIVKCDGHEHLLLLGQNQDSAIQSPLPLFKGEP